MEEENYNNFINFLEIDNKIKEKLIKIAPNKTDSKDLDSKIDYYDKLYKSINEFKAMFKSAISIFKDDGINVNLDEFFDNLYRNMINIDMKDSCNKTYSRLFSDMSKRYVNEVNENCVGKDDAKIINNAKTINELLYGIYFEVLNNEKIIKDLPKIDEKKIIDKNETSDFILLGKDNNKLARKVFDMLCENKNIKRKNGFWYIVEVDDKILVMAKDSGHAITIEINMFDAQKSERKFSKGIQVIYFISKVTNLDEVKSLPGIDNASSKNASGKFIIDNTKLKSKKGVKDIDITASKIIDFLYRIPKDGEGKLSIDNFKNFSREAGIPEEWTMEHQYELEKGKEELEEEKKDTKTQSESIDNENKEAKSESANNERANEDIKDANIQLIEYKKPNAFKRVLNFIREKLKRKRSSNDKKIIESLDSNIKTEVKPQPIIPRNMQTNTNVNISHENEKI